jgi:enediyne polyketide synthase
MSVAAGRAFRAIPRSRLDLGAYGGSSDDVDRTYVERAGLIEGWQFDRARFGINGTTFRSVDTVHWLALDVAQRALSDASLPFGDAVDRSRVGVLIGNSLTGERSREMGLRLRWPWVEGAIERALTGTSLSSQERASVMATAHDSFTDAIPPQGVESLAGSLSNTIAGRIANHFDFHGAGYTIDGACASSSLAIADACRNLLAGDLDVAIAGGVDVSLDPLELIGFARLGALAKDEMRVYDANPTGFLPGEGCGLIVLMRRADAERLGLRRYADIAGWGVSSDGRGGITRPEVAGQTLAISRAMSRAGVSSEDVQLIEGHGTGTAVGDAVELTALLSVRRDASRPAALASVKANIGHTKAAAGVASVIRAAMSISAGVRVPATGVERPHPMLSSTSVLKLLPEAQEWEAGRRLAGVSAMGFGGINTHLVLTDPGPSGRTVAFQRPESSFPGAQIELLPLAASSPDRLREHLITLRRQLEVASEDEFYRLAATLRIRFGASRRWEFRAVVVGVSAASAAEEARLLLALLDEPESWSQLRRTPRGSATGAYRKTVGLMFPGQAAPVRWELGELEEYAPPIPTDELRKREGTASAQPAIMRSSLAGLGYLDSLGLDADGAVGHSLGEIAAYVWAGAIAPQAALDLAATRGELMQTRGVAGTGMISVQGRDLKDALTKDRALHVACYNGGETYVLAGASEALDEAAATAAQRHRGVVRLPVSHGFHSPAMEPAVAPFSEALERVSFDLPRRPILSTVGGGALDVGSDWKQNLRDQLTQPVRFETACAPLLGLDLLVEVGSGHLLSDMVRGAFGHRNAVSIDVGGKPEDGVRAIAALYAAGRIDISRADADRERDALDLGDMPLLLETLLRRDQSGLDPQRNATTSRRELAYNSNKDDQASPELAEPEPASDGATQPSVLDDEAALAATASFLAQNLELPLSLIREETSLLRDLHINSLRVAQLVAELLREQGRPPLHEPLDAAAATVRDISSLLTVEAEAPGSADANPGPSWAQGFRHDWVATSVHTQVAPIDALVVFLARTASPSTDVDLLAELLVKVRSEPQAPLILIHDGCMGIAGLARSIAAEQPDRRIQVIEMANPRALERYPEMQSGYQEYRLEGDVWQVSATTPTLLGTEREAAGLRDGVVLVTGGVSGMMLDAAQALSNDARHTIVVVGRRSATDAGVKAALHDLPGHVQYRSCDIADSDAVRNLLEDIRGLGPVRVLLHGAGVNAPQSLAQVSRDSLYATWQPKAIGLTVLFDALEPVAESLDMVLAFGSIIARRGLQGQTEYASANDAMRSLVERWSAEHPAVRAHCLEWSVWAGRGMGESLGVLDSLRAMGVEPIMPEQGMSLLRAVAADESLPTTLLLTSRCPDGPGLKLPRDSSSEFFRFDESRIENVAGTIAVTESVLSVHSDLYLADHLVDGTAVLPAVMGLEAVAQTARVGGRGGSGWLFRDVHFDRGILISGAGERRLRVSAVREPGRAEWRASISDDDDDFLAPRFRMSVAELSSDPQQLSRAVEVDECIDPSPWYGPLFFHGARFRRLESYRQLSAFNLEATLGEAMDLPWFGPLLSPVLELGDLAALDASLHALMAAAPHRRVLPVGAKELVIVRPGVSPALIRAVDRSYGADEFEFDIDLLDDEGEVTAAWRGLRLRAVGSRAADHFAGGLPLELVGPWLSRIVLGAGGPPIEILLRHDEATSTAAAQARGWQPVRAHAGMSAAHADEFILLARALVPKVDVGIDAEIVGGSAPELAAVGGARAAQLSTAAAGRPIAPLSGDAGARDTVHRLGAWTMSEALVKLGLRPDTPVGIGDRVEGMTLWRGDAVNCLTGAITVSHAGESLELVVTIGWFTK